MNADQVYRIQYEALTQQPHEQMQALIEFLQVELPETMTVEQMVQGIRSQSVGNWKQQLSQDDQREIHRLMGDFLKELGYELPG